MAYETVNKEKTLQQVVIKYILIALAIIVGWNLIYGSWFVVKTGQVALVQRFGQLKDATYEQGGHAKMPFIDHVVRYSLQTIKGETTAAAASKDLQNVAATIAVNYSVDPNLVTEMYTKIGSLDKVQTIIINPAVQEVIKSVTAKYTASELITSRANVSSDINTQLIEKLSKNSITVEDVNIINFDFSDSFNAAIELKVTAEQTALAEKNNLAKIEYQAQQQVATAKGNAEATKINALAEAEAIKIKTQAINGQGGKDYVALKAIEQWKGGVPTTYVAGGGNNGGFIFNIPLTQ